MFRLSRIECPRGSLLAFALLAAALLAFGIVAEAGLPGVAAVAEAQTAAGAAFGSPAPAQGC